MKLFAGIVGATSHTVTLLADNMGNILGYGVAGPANYHVVGLWEAIRAIRESLWDALMKSEMRLREIACVTLGLAGLDTYIDFEKMYRGIKQRFPSCNVVLRHESEIALAGALAGEPGVVVIASIGSVAAGMNVSGRFIRCGGWGPLLGDEGSAYDIGRRALVAVLREYDGRGESTLLMQMILERFNIECAEEIIDIVYNKGLDVKEIAALTPLVVRAAEEGDAVAKNIISYAMRALAEMVSSVVRRLYLDELEVIKVAVMGSVFNTGDIVLEAFRKHIVDFINNVELIKPLFPPAVGALLISYRFNGVKLSRDLMVNLERTSQKVPPHLLTQYSSMEW